MLPKMLIQILMSNAINVGKPIFLKKYSRGVFLYFKYCVMAVSIPIIIAIKICTWFSENFGSSGGAIFVPNILLKTGVDVFAVTIMLARNITNEPMNIQNSRL